MKKNFKLNFSFFLFFILVYSNQGLSDLPSQSIYYLTRESWKLSATTLGLIGFLTSLAWYIKPLFGYLNDFLPIKGYRSKYYLLGSYILLILSTLYIVIFGLNIMNLFIIFTLMNFCIALNDVANDTQMCIAEKKHNLKGKIQAIQWIALGIAGLFVALGGAWIAEKFPNTINYRIAFGLTLIIPVITLFYLIKIYKEKKINPGMKSKFNWNNLKNKNFILGISFVAFLRFSPSFGTALMIQMREGMGIDKLFVGYLGATGTILGIIGYGLYYWKAHKLPIKKLLYFAIIFSALSNLCYLYIPNKWVILTYNLVFGAFDGIAFLTILAFIAKIIPKGSEGLMYALVTSINNFSAKLGTVMGGIIYDNVGYSANVIIASITTLICLFFIPRLKINE
jgi:MFS family permease